MTLTALWRLIRTLFAALGAPVCMVARVWRRDEGGIRRFADLLGMVRQRGWLLRYDGEDEAIVAARIDKLNWIARDPVKAMRHLARRLRGWKRWRLAAQEAPVSWTPPKLPLIALALAPPYDPLVDIDTC